MSKVYDQREATYMGTKIIEDLTLTGSDSVGFAEAMSALRGTPMTEPKPHVFLPPEVLERLTRELEEARAEVTRLREIERREGDWKATAEAWKAERDSARAEVASSKAFHEKRDLDNEGLASAVKHALRSVSMLLIEMQVSTQLPEGHIAQQLERIESSLKAANREFSDGAVFS